jgi:DNA polymerase-3 subunit delta'
VIHPWLEPLWARVIALEERLPHALLVSGAPGLGKRDFAEALAARLLCESLRKDGEACGTCVPCQWRKTGNHPDLHRLVPANGQAAESGEEEGEAKEGEAREGKAASTQIVVDQMRMVQDALAVTAHRGRRIVIVDPAEAMNAVTANALLKLLEEPPPGCHFVLVSSQVSKLLPTIRSRCQQWPVPHPDPGQFRRWQARQDGAARIPANLLALTGGMPLAAQRLAGQGAEARFERFVADLRIDALDPVKLAGQWEDWLKKDKAALAQGFDLAMLVDWMQRWVSDLAMLRLGGRPRYFPGERETLEKISARMNISDASSCYNDLLNIRRVVTHPLNLRLYLEDMLMRYTAAVGRTVRGARS